MRVAVTGGSGSLGQLVAKRLVGDGYDVVTLDRLPSPNKTIPSILVDLTNFENLLKALERCDAVVHLSSHRKIDTIYKWLKDRDHQTLIDWIFDPGPLSVNPAATYNILNASHRHNITNIVIASSKSAFGFMYRTVNYSPLYLPIDEKHPSNPQDSYSLSKYIGEKIADSFAIDSNMTICSFRFPALIPGYDDFEDRWKCQDTWGKGALWSYLDCRDAATACALGLKAKFKGHEVFLLSASNSDNPRPTHELIAKYYPETKNVPAEMTGNWSCVNTTKARSLLGWTPKYRWETELPKATKEAAEI
jgi:nucleoside-diphosphate-sugar epimerase